MKIIHLRELRDKSGAVAYDLCKNKESFLLVHGNVKMGYLTPFYTPEETFEPLRHAQHFPTIKRLYDRHKNSARSRGIGWHFTLASWVDWWYRQKGAYWIKYRGTTKGKYVMARKGDKGPYAPWNVECITCNQNHSDRKGGRMARGVDHYCHKLTEAQVKMIYQSEESHVVLAMRHGITKRVIHQIKHNHIWKHITRHLGKAHINSRGPISKR